MSEYSSTRKKIIGTFTVISIFMILFNLAGILLFKSTHYQIDAIVWFIVTGLISLVSIIVVIYNIVMMIKERSDYLPINPVDF